MALTKGTNCGFVSSAPSTDPNATLAPNSGYTVALKDTSPAGTNNVTALGWYQSASNNNSDDDYDLAVYSHDATNNRPNTIVGSKATGQATTADTEGWYTYTGLSISIDASTTYWLAIGVESTGAYTGYDRQDSAGDKYDYKDTGDSMCPATWGTSNGTSERLLGVYALYAAASGASSTPSFQYYFNNARP